MNLITGLSLFSAFCTSARAADADMAWVAVSEDGRGFVLAESGRVFAPWGFNYDHDGAGPADADNRSQGCDMGPWTCHPAA